MISLSGSRPSSSSSGLLPATIQNTKSPQHSRIVKIFPAKPQTKFWCKKNCMLLTSIKDISLNQHTKSFSSFKIQMCQEISAHRIVKIHAPILIFSSDCDVGAAATLNSLFEKKNQMEGTSLLKHPLLI